MEKLVIIAYVGVKQCSGNDVVEYLEKISEVFGNKLGDDVYCLIVPRWDTTEITVDCINPKLLDAEQYKKVEASVKEFQDAVDEIMKKRKGED